ncbi:methyltransferase-like protein 23 isoform X3 [Cricetulus griseus]|uniref:Methyltransferase-like protein 23 isoform X3 n=1 Tax=Cricetulus griseus TaxID=10029 RepID=A0A9J7H3T3_CRIGR|nr:methyltransferase-like protein 23 isoform X3 [Cricetulus griseus]
MRFLLLWFIPSRSPSGSATTSTPLAPGHQETRPLPPRPARPRNALRSGQAPSKSPSRKFTSRPPRALRVGRAAAVLPAPPPAAGRHWPQRPARSAFTRADWAPCWEGRFADVLPLPAAARTASGCASRPPRSASGQARCRCRRRCRYCRRPRRFLCFLWRASGRLVPSRRHVARPPPARRPCSVAPSTAPLAWGPLASLRARPHGRGSALSVPGEARPWNGRGGAGALRPAGG